MEGDVIGGVIDAGEYRALDAFRASWPYIPSRPIVWDVGANVGDYSTSVLRRFPHAVLWAFEPQSGAHRTLSERLASFPATHDSRPIRRTALNVGLSSENHTDLLHKTGHPACYLASIVPQSGERLGVSIDHTEEARFFTGDRMMRMEGVGHIDWLKIDVEGHEYAVLDGFADTLSTVGVVQAEYNDAAVERGIRFRDLWDRLVPQFEVYRLDVDGTVTEVEEPGAEEGGGQRNYVGVNTECEWFRWDRPAATADSRQDFEHASTGEAA